MSLARQYVLLMILYTLQGIPMGLSGTLPFLLESKISFTQQAMFAVVSWPFSLKLLWAPIVDGCFSERIGRRRTWVLPTQMLCGILMVYVAYSGILSNWMGDIPGIGVNVTMLTAFFLFLYFLMATQDIAVDGWALTLLPVEKQHLAGNINAAGQTLGYFLSYVVFLILNNADYCDMIRSKPTGQPFLTLNDFFWLSGGAFILTTVYVWLFVCEEPEEAAKAAQAALQRAPSVESVLLVPPTSESSTVDGVRTRQPAAQEGDALTSATSASGCSPTEAVACDEPETLGEVFRQFGLLFRNVQVQTLSAILFCQGAALSVQSSALQLKVVHAGFPTTQLAVWSPLLIGIGILLPVIMARFIKQGNQLLWLWRSMLIQLLVAPLATMLPRWVEADISLNGSVSQSTLILILSTTVLATVQSNTAFCALLAFFPAVADPLIGGTPAAMILVQWLDDHKAAILQNVAPELHNVSGYEMASLFCLGLTIMFVIFAKKPLLRLQGLPTFAWWVRKSALEEQKSHSKLLGLKVD